LASSALTLLQSLGSHATTVQEAINDPIVNEYIKAGIGRANKRATSSAQNVQKFLIVPKEFTIEGGELTPTVKVKRRVVLQQYQEQIDKMYNTAE